MNAGKTLGLTLKSNRSPDSKETDTIDLFNAIERAFEFEKNIHPFIDVKSVFKDVSYKRICRDLAGCDSNTTGYLISEIYVYILAGDWPEYYQYCGNSYGKLSLKLNSSSIFGDVAENNFNVIVDPHQYQKNIGVTKGIKFFLSNDTILTVSNLKPESSISIHFNISEVHTLLKKTISPHAIIDDK